VVESPPAPSGPTPEELRLREEEEKRKREEEEALRVAAQKAEEEAAQMAEIKSQATVELKVRQQLHWLRQKNLSASTQRPDIFHFKSLNSTITKCSAFAKKCAKLAAENADALLKELRSLNLSKYVSEVAVNIASAPLKPTDLDAAVAICSELHQLYADFATELSPLLLRLISPASKTDLSPRRMALRLYVDLYVAGVFTDESALNSIVKESLDAKDPKQMPVTLQLVLSFVRSGGRDILGLIPKSMEEKLARFKQSGHLEPLSNSTGADILPYEPVLEGLISSDRKSQFIAQITSFYQKMSTVYLQSHRKLREVEQKNQELLATRHELSQETSAAYTKQLEQFENFQKTLISLSDILRLEMAALPQQEKVTRIKESKANSSANDMEENEDQGPWDGDDTRKFYEVIPDLKDFLPSSLLAIDTKATSETPSSSAPASSTNPPGNSSSTQAQSANSVDPTASSSLSASSSTVPPSAAEDSTKASTTATDAGKVENAPDVLVSFFEKLNRCSNRQLIDEAAMEFVKFNQKAWRTKLASLMHQAPRNRLDTLRYYSRFVAILNPYFKDIGSTLVKRLEEEFEYLYKQKDQTNSPSKLWNVRFLGELTKFKVCPPNTVLNFLKRCLDDFIGYNVHVACELVDTCGRYLLFVPETRVRTTNLLDQMAQLKTTRQFHVTLEILIDNALQTARPVERVVRQKAQLPPLRQYVHKLLYLDLRNDTLSFVVTQLKKLPWQQEEDYLLLTMLKMYKNKYQHIHLIASIVAQLSTIHETFGIKFLDHLLEDIRVNLEQRRFNNHQKLVMNVTLVGELINNKLADAKLFYKLLYTLIRYNTITFPKSGPMDLSFKPENTSREAQRESSANIYQAWVEDSFRVRLVCTLMTTCKNLSSFDSFNPSSQNGRIQHRDLETFLLYFQRFLFMQRHISPELHSLLDDTWFVVRPPYLLKTPDELEDKLKSVRSVRPTFEGTDERLSLPYPITSVTAQSALEDEEEDQDVEVEQDPQADQANAESTTQSGSHPSQDSSAKSSAPAQSEAAKQEDELAKMFDTMMQDSLALRTNVNTRANSIFSVPLMALKKKAEVLKSGPTETLIVPSIQKNDSLVAMSSEGERGKSLEFEEEDIDEDGEESDEEDVGSSEESGEEEEGDVDDEDEDDEDEDDVDDDEFDEFDDPELEMAKNARHVTSHQPSAPTPSMSFQLLGRKPGNKPVLGSIEIPLESSMVKRHLHAQERAQQQREATAAVTMKLYRMGEEADAKRDTEGQIQTHGQKAPLKPVQPTTYAAAVEALSTSAPRKTFTPQIDPVVPRVIRSPKK
jgi:regulator of nonsense transcripts 2